MPFVVIMLTWFYGIVRVVIALIMKNNVDSVFYGTISLGGLAVIIVIGMIFFVLDRIKERDNKYRRHKYGGSAGASSSSDGATNNMGESTRIFDENNRLFNEQAQRDYDQMNQQQNDFNNWNNNNMF